MMHMMNSHSGSCVQKKCAIEFISVHLYSKGNHGSLTSKDRGLFFKDIRNSFHEWSKEYRKPPTETTNDAAYQ